MFRSMRGEARATRPILEESEREILDCQRRTGFDFYWRVYFLFTGRIYSR